MPDPGITLIVTGIVVVVLLIDYFLGEEEQADLVKNEMITENNREILKEREILEKVYLNYTLTPIPQDTFLDWLIKLIGEFVTETYQFLVVVMSQWVNLIVLGCQATTAIIVYLIAITIVTLIVSIVVTFILFTTTVIVFVIHITFLSYLPSIVTYIVEPIRFVVGFLGFMYHTMKFYWTGTWLYPRTSGFLFKKLIINF